MPWLAAGIVGAQLIGTGVSAYMGNKAAQRGPDGLGPGGLPTTTERAKQTPNIRAGGLTSTSGLRPVTFRDSTGRNRTIDVLDTQVTGSPERQGLVNSLSQTFGSQAAQIGGLLPQVSPGFGQLTQARVTAIRDARDRAVGNARDELARRRVLGSSFGQDVLNRTNAEFAKEESAARAQSFLEEFQATVNLINQETTAKMQQFNTLLGEMNLQADAAMQISQGSTAALSASNAALEGIAAAEAQNRGNTMAFVGQQVGNAPSNFMSQMALMNALGIGGGGGGANAGTYGGLAGLGMGGGQVVGTAA